MKWISVLDKVPGNERKVLVWLEKNNIQLGPEIAFFDPFCNKQGNDGWFLDGGYIPDLKVTCWCEIIAPA